ncbi:lipase maturation factor [Saccharopolyspora erythraea NRRL 2338]|uniref:Integral membrane protein n=2 Tax=Saccharopolyspora erythraea TaxID=1836 RepID=A4FB78_SACEN|nr:lipase maturation factor family protein [Saccharopolyspora erythraea]EQD83976.1 membrane protein [Saccharopolyspora erythraea D]PFG95085.1 lipase maturation factor [Saccharopolyspora erythraea NRRL 2338]QRK91763.1 lipase maturation factor family protein [Saccharopolyspora erythraea]CAM01303.1 integral membrane protein [Saccharopolyspora erythraea NRRL 2338]
MNWQWFVSADYAQARFVVQHLLALTYLLAFLTAVNQFRPLLGEHGLTPVPRFLAAAGFRRAPSLFHLHYSDRFFAAVAWLGTAVSAAVLAGAADVLPLWASMVVWALLWVLYLSIVNIGQVWYSFGWESLLLEAGFLAIFLGPAHVPPPMPVLWLMCWLLFRVEFGAGLIKMRGDSCWRDLTALYYHHETQPMPGPLSRRFHQLPRPLHRVEVAANHFTQLVVPFGLFAPQPVASVAAVIVVVTQLWLVLSGNFAWLNLVTITLAFAAMGPQVLGWLPVPLPDSPAPVWWLALVLVLTATMVALSYWPVRNMLGRRQVMNRSFNKLHLGNTYGAFGSITRTRYEVVVEGRDGGSRWREYDFKGKPGDPMRRPPQVAPYHLRLDWLMWFCAISPGYGRGWLPRFLEALLRNDRHVLKLLRRNPFPESPPTEVRARFFRYRFTTARERRETGAWWVRDPVGEYVPPVSLDDLAR